MAAGSASRGARPRARGVGRGGCRKATLAVLALAAVWLCCARPASATPTYQEKYAMFQEKLSSKLSPFGIGDLNKSVMNTFCRALTYMIAGPCAHDTTDKYLIECHRALNTWFLQCVELPPQGDPGGKPLAERV